MDIKLINRLAMIGIAAVGIGDILFSTDKDVLDIQKNVFLDMNDVIEVERQAEERKRRHEQELYYKGYTGPVPYFV